MPSNHQKAAVLGRAGLWIAATTMIVVFGLYGLFERPAHSADQMHRAVASGASDRSTAPNGHTGASASDLPMTDPMTATPVLGP